MTQREHLLWLFRVNGGKLTLRAILETTLAAEYRARITEMRRDGYRIDFKRGATPSENTYTLVPQQIEIAV